MKRTIYLLTALLLLLVGCSKTEQPECCGQSDKTVRISLTAEADRHTIVSRSLADENGIHDMNVYLFSEGQSKDYHFYIPHDVLSIEVLRNNYDVYIIGNYGSDMGVMSKEALSSLTFPMQESPDLFPMSYQGAHSFMESQADVMLQLTRALAKVDLEVIVAPAANGIELRSVRLVNVPIQGYYYSSLPSTDAGMYAEQEVMPYAIGHKMMTASFYLPENKQGTVSSIATQQMKNPDNAPPFATYLIIRAEKMGRWIEYAVMLGENNTTDFNVLRNHNYKVVVDILSENESDARISAEIRYYRITYDSNGGYSGSQVEVLAGTVY